MKVIFLPDWRKGNPYLQLLVDHLGSNGVEVNAVNYFPSFALLKTVLRHKDGDILHLHWINPYYEWLSWSQKGVKFYIKLILCYADLFLTKALGKKVVWTVHNAFQHENALKDREKLFRRLLFSFADAVLVHSASAVHEIQSHYGLKRIDKIHVVPHGHYIDYYVNEISKKEARKKIGLGEQDKAVLFLGAIRPYKGLQGLLSAFFEIDESRDIILILAGKCHSEAYKKELLRVVNGKDNIRLHLYFIEDKDIQVFMNAADVCALPFENILTSGSAILAMSFGKPLIVPDKPTLRDILDEKGAFFYKNRDDLKKILSGCFKFDLQMMGSYNKDRIKRFDWNDISCQLKDVYEKISH